MAGERYGGTIPANQERDNAVEETAGVRINSLAQLAETELPSRSDDPIAFVCSPAAYQSVCDEVDKLTARQYESAPLAARVIADVIKMRVYYKLRQTEDIIAFYDDRLLREYLQAGEKPVE